MDFKPNLFRRNKGRHFILIKETTNKEEIRIIIKNTANIRSSNFIKKKTQLDLKY